MLTLKLITENTERVIKGLEKKHFQNARQAIEQVLATDKQRREAQQQLDNNKMESNQLSKQIGALMKEGKRSEAEEVKNKVAQLKQNEKINKDLTQIALFGNATEGAEDVIRHFLLASSGKVSLGKDSWKMLMSAVETLYPGFLEAIMDRQQGHLHEPLLRTICLLKIGMKPSQIARVMDAKKQTVWSRVKRAEEMCGSLLRAD